MFLRQLPSGLLLVTGPHKVNGVPVKRVNQTYTITTSTRVNLAGVDVSKVNDATFARGRQAGGRDFFAQGAAVSNDLLLIGVLEKGGVRRAQGAIDCRRRGYLEES